MAARAPAPTFPQAARARPAAKEGGCTTGSSAGRRGGRIARTVTVLVICIAVIGRLSEAHASPARRDASLLFAAWADESAASDPGSWGPLGESSPSAPAAPAGQAGSSESGRRAPLGESLPSATAAAAAVEPAARKDGLPALEGPADPSLARRALAVGASLVPGFLLHGSGHYVLGEREAARRILILEGIGFGSFVAGMAALLASGGSEKAAPLYVVPAIAGATTFLGTWFIDVVGSARGSPAEAARPPRPREQLAASLGYAGLVGGPFSFERLGTLGLAWDASRLWADARFAADPGTARYAAGEARFGWAVWRPERAGVDELSAVARLSHQRFAPERFNASGAELYAESVVGLRHLAPTLANLWTRARLGAGIDGYRLRPTAAAARWHGRALLVVGFGIGLQAAPWLSFEVDYWQTKHELPGGLVVAGGLDGFFGMLELHGRLRLSDRIALLGGARAGASVMPWASLEVRAW